MAISTGCRWLCVPTLGLLLVFVLLGHDIAMAGDSHVPLDQRTHHEAGESESHVAWHGDAAPRATDPNLPDGECGVAPDVVAVDGGVRRLSDRGQGIPVEVLGLSRPTGPDVRQDEAPTRSPAVRRALIQVYRI